MPHFTIEYSANLDGRIDMSQVVDLVRREAIATGIFPLGGIRVRAIPCPYVSIADGSPAAVRASAEVRSAYLGGAQ